MKPCRCITTAQSMGVIFVGDPDWYREEIDRQCDKDLGTTITDYGFDINIGDLCIPIPVSLVDLLAEVGIITCYAGENESYELIPVYNLSIPATMVIEAKGAFKYKTAINS